MCVMCMCMCVMCMYVHVCDVYVHVCDVYVRVQLVQMEVHISLLRKGYVRGGTSTLDLDQYATKVYIGKLVMLVILYILNDDLHVHHVKYISMNSRCTIVIKSNTRLARTRMHVSAKK